MEAKKFIEKKKEGEYEFIKNHVLVVDEKFKIDFNEICDKLDLWDIDAEDSYYNYGVGFDLDGDLYIIEVTKFIKGVKRDIDDDDEFEPEEKEEIEEFLKKIEKYKEYTIYI